MTPRARLAVGLLVSGAVHGVVLGGILSVREEERPAKSEPLRVGMMRVERERAEEVAPAPRRVARTPAAVPVSAPTPEAVAEPASKSVDVNVDVDETATATAAAAAAATAAAAAAAAATATAAATAAAAATATATAAATAANPPTVASLSPSCWQRISTELHHRTTSQLPRNLRRRGLTGRVVLRFRLDTSGTASALTIEQSSGSPLLDELASSFVREPLAQGCAGEGRWAIEFTAAGQR